MAVDEKNRSVALIIDDDPLILTYFEGRLPKMGFTRVETHLRLATAKEALKNSQLSLVICDLDMPDEDGFEFLSYVDTLKMCYPIIVCSGCSEQLIRVLKKLLKFHVSLNVIDTIIKPINLLELAKAVARARQAALPEQRSAPSFGVRPYTIEEILAWVDVYFQPKWRCRDNTIIGAEALARVLEPNGKVISPFFFIPTIKSSQMSGEFTFRVIEKTVIHIAKLPHLEQSLKFSINIGVNDLKNPDFYRRVIELVNQYRLPSGMICFEITEDEIYDNDMVILANMGRLIIAGYTFSLDDFGTGFSNFERLGQLPISEIKLDKLFIDHLDESNTDEELIKAFVSIAKSLDLITVVEGVETAEQLKVVTRLGIDTQQGYYLAKPCPFEQFLHYLTP